MVPGAIRRDPSAAIPRARRASYVIGEVWNGMRRYGHRELGLWLLSLGFLAGIATDLVVV